MIATIQKPPVKQPVVDCKRCHRPFTIANSAALALYNAGRLDCMDCVRPQKGVWTRSQYGDYLQTSHWRERRQRALKKALYACQVCKDLERLEVHHNTYERLGGELDSDLLVLCRDCHELFHARLDGLAY